MTSRNEKSRQSTPPGEVEQTGRSHQQFLLVAIGALLAVVLVTGGFQLSSWWSDRGTVKAPASVVAFDYTGGQHQNGPIDYPESPPVGGAHNPVWQSCDFYNGIIPNENAVHSLEHGAVWITYRSDISATDKKTLEQWATDRSYLLISEYSDQQTPFVFTAWNNQLALDSLASKKATEFLDYFIQGPQTPERGASCKGGNTALLQG